MLLLSTFFSRLLLQIIILTLVCDHKMRLKEQKEVSEKSKLQIKGVGVSTKNYVSVYEGTKKYLKCKEISLGKRQHFQTYLYRHMLSLIQRKQGRTSMLQLKSIKMEHEKLTNNEQQNINFSIQRQFITYSLKNVLDLSIKIETKTKIILLHQVLNLFVQFSNRELPLLCPINLLVNRNWKDQFEVFANFTSTVCYDLFIDQEGIFIDKFKEIYGYLHPQCFDWEKGRINIDFKCKLYSLALNIYSILFNKEVSYPLYAQRDKNRINIYEGREKIEKSYRKVVDLFDSNNVRQKLTEFQKKIGKNNMNFCAFFQKIFWKKECPYYNWTDVLKDLSPQYFTIYLRLTPSRIYDSLKLIHDNEEEETKIYYEKMGIIHRNCQIADKQQLLLYFLVKYQKFKMVEFNIDHQSQTYCPQLFLQCCKINEQADKIKAKTEQMEPPMTDLHEYFEQSRKLNIIQMQNPDQKEQVFYISNEQQQIMSNYELNLWL